MLYEKNMETKSSGFGDYQRHLLETVTQGRAVARLVETNAAIIDVSAQIKSGVDKILSTLDSEAQYAIQLKSEIQFLRSEVEFWKHFAISNIKQNNSKQVNTTGNGGLNG
jgi:CO dehydrogenase nickel-insertion accessory protein CooC1